MSHANLPIPELAEKYIAYLQTKDDSLQWASFEVIDLCIDGPWESVWSLVQYVANRDEDPGLNVIGGVAAGPLEDLLANAGAEYIAAIEQLARRNPRAARMLTGVWKSNIEPEVWSRVVSFCRSVPDPLDGVYGY